MDAIGIIVCLVLAGSVGVLGVRWFWKQKRMERMGHWPVAVGTIESSALEVAHSDQATVKLPVFAFSYQVRGEYYSGRFALLPYTATPDESLMDRMVGRRLQVHYNPQRVADWFISDALIEGCKIEQKLGDHFIGYYPR